MIMSFGSTSKLCVSNFNGAYAAAIAVCRDAAEYSAWFLNDVCLINTPTEAPLSQKIGVIARSRIVTDRILDIRKLLTPASPGSGDAWHRYRLC
jgi:hypothetical protein